MASDFSQYAWATIEVEGVGILAQEASISIDRNTNSQPVFTTVLGYNGESPGAGVCELSVDSAVPSTGFELDPGRYMSALCLNTSGLLPNGVTFIIHLATGQSLNFKGYIYTDNFSHAVNSASKLSFKARGKFSNTWE